MLQIETRGKQRWVIIGFFFLSGILTATWTSRIPAIQDKLQLSNAALGTVLFAIPAGLVTGLSVASWLIASYGAKRILLISALLSSLFLILAATASTTIQLMVILFFVGLGRTIYNLAANTSAMDVQRLYEKPIISNFHGIWSISCFIAVGFGTLMIIENVSTFYHFLSIGILASIASLLLIGKKNRESIINEKKPFFVMPDKYLFQLGILALCAMVCEGAMFDWSVNYFKRVVKADTSMITIGYLAFIITMAGGRLIGDKLIAAHGVFKILFVNSLLMAAGFIIAALFPFVLPAAIGFALVGIGDSILVPVIYMLAAKTKKMQTSYALSSVTILGYTGFLIGPIFIGNISDLWGMQTAFFCLGIISMFIIFMTWHVRKLSLQQE